MLSCSSLNPFQFLSLLAFVTSGPVLKGAGSAVACTFSHWQLFRNIDLLLVFSVTNGVSVCDNGEVLNTTVSREIIFNVALLNLCFSLLTQNVWCRWPKIRTKKVDSLFWGSDSNYLLCGSQWLRPCSGRGWGNGTLTLWVGSPSDSQGVSMALRSWQLLTEPKFDALFSLVSGVRVPKPLLCYTFDLGGHVVCARLHLVNHFFVSWHQELCKSGLSWLQVTLVPTLNSLCCFKTSWCVN